MNWNRITLHTLLITSLLPGCILQAQQGTNPDPNCGKNGPERQYGESAPLGAGQVRTYVVLGKDKDKVTGRKPPVDVGVEIPSAVLSSLPPDMQILNFNFPIQARDTAVQFMMLGWNPQGHPPAGVYDRPHLDFHFYIQDLDDVMTIDPGDCSGLACDDYARAVKPVPPQFLPKGYSDIGEVAPMMGNHLVDLSAPEFHGKPFTRTFLYGAYDGQITFFEPMITNESLIAAPRQCAEVNLPAQYAQTAYQPTRYCTEFDSNKQVIRVFLTGFVYRTAEGQ
jgi:hypothetical protein